MKSIPDISIVVLNYNTSDLLEGALQSIRDTTTGLSFDVTVIDNASKDGGLSRIGKEIRGDARFSFIERTTNIGWAAINDMLSRTQGKYIVTLDPDALLHQGALQTLYSFMEKTPRAGAATAKLLNPDGSAQLYYRRTLTPRIIFFTTLCGRFIDKYFLGLRQWNHYRYGDLDLSKVTEVEQPAWPCLMWRREALGEYIVDSRIPFYFVDVDMSRRLYDRGYKIYLVPTATITHLKSTSFGRANALWRQKEYYRSLSFYFQKHYPYHAPFIWVMLVCDRALRALVTLLLGREPLR